MPKVSWSRAGLRGVVGDTLGAEIAEAAVVMPLVFMLLLGIYWFGRAYNIYATIGHAAREGARAAAGPSCALCGNASLAADQVAAQVGQALQASKLDPAQVTPLTPIPALNDCQTGAAASCVLPAGGQPQICFLPNVQLNTGTTDAKACGVSVSFQYPYQFWLPFTSLNKQRILLKADVQMMGENLEGN
jgi:TadE-like protein